MVIDKSPDDVGADTLARDLLPGDLFVVAGTQDVLLAVKVGARRVLSFDLSTNALRKISGGTVITHCAQIAPLYLTEVVRVR